MSLFWDVFFSLLLVVSVVVLVWPKKYYPPVEWAEEPRFVDMDKVIHILDPDESKFATMLMDLPEEPVVFHWNWPHPPKVSL